MGSSQNVIFSHINNFYKHFQLYVVVDKQVGLTIKKKWKCKINPPGRNWKQTEFQVIAHKQSQFMNQTFSEFRFFTNSKSIPSLNYWVGYNSTLAPGVPISQCLAGAFRKN